MSAGLRFLARRARSRAELERKLEAKGFSAAEVRGALGRLEDLGYVDDRKLATEAGELLRQRGYGSARIRYDLERRGIDPALVKGVLPTPAEERQIARAVLVSRRREGRDERKERARLTRLLASRGFSPHIVEWAFGTWDDDGP